MAETLELALLGNPEIHLAGQPLARLRSAKTYALLYYLAVTRRAQPRTTLAGLFWGDVDEYYARRNLNRTLSDLTKTLGEHLTVERQSLALARSQPYWLDVEILEGAASTRPLPENVAELAIAANLYRGDFLAGFYVHDAPDFEQWVSHERTRLRTDVLQLHHALANFYAEQGDLRQAMDYARRSLQLEPWREESHRQLMLLLAQSGQRSAALAQFELCSQALRSELNVEPDAATMELVARIRAGTLGKLTGDKVTGDKVTGDKVTGDKVTGDKVTIAEASPSPDGHPVIQSPSHLVTPPLPHNLPGQRTPFVGRAAELADITRLLVEEADCRLLTLVGQGGMGKTRLAIKTAEQIVADPNLHAEFRDGVFFIPLENAGDANSLAVAVIAAVTAESGMRSHSESSLPDQLVHLLRTKAMLLVLDNFEHLVMHADLCSTLLAAAPNVKLLITSREAIGLQEAWFYPLLGLTTPNGLSEPDARQDEYDAVHLFIQCARRTRPDFAPTAERPAMLRICTLVEGMPLGIELAATWLKVLNCEQIAQEIARGLDFLTTRFQNVPPRHRSMRAVLDHSWALLTVAEQDAIARLAIFRGQFSKEAAAAVTGASLFMLAALVEKVLLRVTAAGYYQLHELTRQYAAEKLSAEAKAALYDAYAVYYAGLLDQQRPRLFSAAYRQVWTTVGGELDNIRHAWAWIIDAVRTGRTDLPVASMLLQMAEVLTCYHLFHSLWLSGQALFDHACEVLTAAGWAHQAAAPPGQISPRAALLHLRIRAGQFQLEMGHFRTSLILAEQTLADSRAFGLEEDLFRALMVYAHTQVRRGARAAALPIFQEALALSERLRSARYCAEAEIGLGMIATGEGDYTAAQGHIHRALKLCQEIGYRPWMARMLTNLGTTFSRQYDYQSARPYYEQALTIAQEEGDQNIVMICTSNLGSVLYGFDQHRASIDYYQRSLAMARALGEERWIAANLNGVSTVYLKIGDEPASAKALHEALTVGQRSDSTPDTLGSIALLGHLFARRGQVEAAIKALTFVEQHRATLARDKLYNQPLLDELRSELPPELFAQAKAWADNQTLDEVVEWLQQIDDRHLNLGR
ncbi:MAG: tetratricopeptide repeat protein [Caldilineaceae bacterium]